MPGLSPTWTAGDEGDPMMPREMIFTMGLPGAGKTTVRVARYPEAQVIDPDAYKEAHPDYNPADPQPLHEWSVAEAEKDFRRALLEADGQWIVDGTGTNAEKMVRRMVEAKAVGYRVRLVYVVVTMQTALERNAARTRRVHEEIVREKALNIATSFELIAPYADAVEVIRND